MMGKSHLCMNGCILVQSVCVSEMILHSEVSYVQPVRLLLQNFVAEFVQTVSVSSIGFLAVGIFLYLLGSLVPDMDSSKSILGRYLCLPVEHHGVTHSIWFLCVLILPIFGCFSFIGLFLGCLVHDLVDSVGAQGVCWLYPITKYREYPNGAKVKPHHVVKLYHTMRPSEGVVVGVVVMFTLALLCWRMYVCLF